LYSCGIVLAQELSINMFLEISFNSNILCSDVKSFVFIFFNLNSFFERTSELAVKGKRNSRHSISPRIFLIIKKPLFIFLSLMYLLFSTEFISIIVREGKKKSAIELS
ncbi:MAG: hypothetical protein ACFFDW_04700, partial [Candidatus Thorarchaeota archaeon]